MADKPPYARIRLLIIDDDPLLAEFLREGLETHFSLIMVVAGIEQAKSLMAGPFIFHVVICDYQLKDGTGMELYQWLRENRRNQVPFLMISGKIDPIITKDPAFDFLKKPFQLSDIMSVMGKLPIKGDLGRG